MATELDSYGGIQETDEGTMYAGGSNPYIGQSFTTPNDGVSYTLDSIKIYLKKTLLPTGNLTVRIYAHTGTYGSTSVPTGSILATSANFDVSTLGALFTLNEIAFAGANRITLSANTKYCFIINGSLGDASNNVKTGCDFSSPSHGGNMIISADASSWTPIDTGDVGFNIYGVAPAAGGTQGIIMAIV